MLCMLFKHSVETYLDWKATHASIAPNRYAVRLNQLVEFIGKDKHLAEVTGDDIIRFNKFLSDTNFQCGNQTKKYSNSTIAYSTRILKNFFLFWQGRGESKVNPKEILPIRHVTRLKKVITYNEFMAMSDVLVDSFYDELIKKLVIHMLWDTGMRISELCDMNIADIHDVHPQFGVRSATIRTRKTMRYNLVVWSRETNELLNKYLGIRLCMDDVETDALFINGKRKKAHRVCVRTLQRWITEIADLADIPNGISPHSFRHGKGHHILNSKGNIRDIQAILRHVKPESTYHYLQLNQAEYIETAAKYLTA